MAVDTATRSVPVAVVPTRHRALAPASLAGYAFVAPAILLMLIILVAPVLIAAALSFTDYSLGNPGFEWVGIENYEKMCSRSWPYEMITASATYVLVVVPASIALTRRCVADQFPSASGLLQNVYFCPSWRLCWPWPLSGNSRSTRQSASSTRPLRPDAAHFWNGYPAGTPLAAPGTFLSGSATGITPSGPSASSASGRASASIWCYIWPG